MKRYIILFMAMLSLFLGCTAINAQEAAQEAATETTVTNAIPQVDLDIKVGEADADATIGNTGVKTSFWLDKLPYANKKFQGTPVWQYLAFLIYLVIVYFISRFLTILIFMSLNKGFARGDGKIARLVLASLRAPIRLILFVIFLKIGLELYCWPEWMANVLAKCFQVIVAISVTYAFIKLVDIAFSVWKEKTHADQAFSDQIIPLFNRIARYIIGLLGLITAAANLGIDVTSVLALGSVGALAIGMATQDLLTNVFGGVVVFLDRPFKLGDRVTVEGKDGIVESIGLRSTRIRSLDGFLITVPNKTICNSLVTNISERPNIKTEVNIGVTYETTTEQLRKAIDIVTDIYKNHPMTVNVAGNLHAGFTFPLLSTRKFPQVSSNAARPTTIISGLTHIIRLKTNAMA